MDNNDFTNKDLDNFWSLTSPKIFEVLKTSLQGLSKEESEKRLGLYGANLIKPKSKSDSFTLFISQFKSPIIIILLFAGVLSFVIDDKLDAIIILSIILASGFLGFWQEKGASDAISKLLNIVKIKSTVFRGGKETDIPVEDIVPGDILVLKSGDVIPSDSLIVESKDLFVNESVLTGETYPAEKIKGVLAEETALSARTNTLFMGTHVVSGSGLAVVIHTGKNTEFGKVSERLKLGPPETEFERGIRRFGYLLMEVTLILVISIFAINVYFHRPFMDSFLFSLALAVGLTPQLLPAIISINLSHGAKKMAEKKVIVKRLSSIENIGSMNILCSDKTGTITEGIVQLKSAINTDGNESEKVFTFAYLNAFFESAFSNPLDDAIRNYRTIDVSNITKLDEIPYDFLRKRLSILVDKNGDKLMVTKGALSNILNVSKFAEKPDGSIVDIKEVATQINDVFETLSSQGFRVIGVCYKNMGNVSAISRDTEKDMTFLGLLTFFDPPKKEIVETIRRLKEMGVSLKIITGDNRLIAANVAGQLGLKAPFILTGSEIKETSSMALIHKVEKVDIFAEVEPNQKELIILALKKGGHIVGFMGDGINDVSAMHAADVSISVDSAVDVAKETADIVLLEKDLGVLESGVREGRMTFSNTLKYIFMATSANFGNMFSMAGASLFLPFLPLLPTQILLTNFMTDFPEMTISTDNVDPELVEKPRRWDIKFIRNFMIVFGIISSFFDFMTFGMLLYLKATVEQFRTVWFIESVVSATLIVLVIRTRKPFFKSKPGKLLLIAILIIAFLTIVLPFTPIGRLFQFTAVPLNFILPIGIIVILYMATAETAKHFFYKKQSNLNK